MSKIFNHNNVKVDIRNEDCLYVDIKGLTIYIDTSIPGELIVNSWNNKKAAKSDFEEGDWSVMQQLDRDELVLLVDGLDFKTISIRK